MKIAIICVGVVTLRFRTVPPHGSSNKTRVNRAMPHHRLLTFVTPTTRDHILLIYITLTTCDHRMLIFITLTTRVHRM